MHSIHLRSRTTLLNDLLGVPGRAATLYATDALLVYAIGHLCGMRAWCRIPFSSWIIASADIYHSGPNRAAGSRGARVRQLLPHHVSRPARRIARRPLATRLHSDCAIHHVVYRNDRHTEDICA